MYNTTLESDILRKIKILAAQLEMRQNDLIEEAIRDLIEKYKHPEFGVSNGWLIHATNLCNRIIKRNILKKWINLYLINQTM